MRVCRAASTGIVGLGVSLLLASTSPAQQLAFPGAEGFGRFATGGRGGDVYIVTNLNDSGPGSLRDAVTNRSVGTPRTVVFAVSGTIYLNSTLRIASGNITLAGQSAPGDGICLARYTLDPGGSSNVIIRFIRSRLGDTMNVENDSFTTRFASNMIIDHCSFSWSVDETASPYINSNFTMQWCFATESLNNSVHSKGAHGYGGIWGGLGASMHHNLLAHHNSRNPRFSGAGGHGTDGELVDMRNNVIYNWKGNSCYGGEPTSTGLPSRQNVINNYYRYGPATGTGSIRYRILNPSADATTGAYGLFYVAGNFTTASSTVSNDNWAGGVQGPTTAQLAALRAPSEFAVAPVVTQSAQAAYDLVLAYGGCRRPNRDPVDTRIVGEVSAGTFTYRGSKDGFAGIIDSQTDVGGWPALASAPAPLDTDKDGMPDTWEIARGLDPALASDRNGLDPVTGYTWLEVYLNELAAPAFPFANITAQPASASIGYGSPFSLSVAAQAPANTGSLTYQWYRDGLAIPGATSASYTVASATPAVAGLYQVLVSNAYGPLPSAVAAVAITDQPPSIVGAPSAASVLVGEPVSLSVVAAGSPPLSYQWYRDTQPIDGATSATFTLAAAALADAGDYFVTVTNPQGSASTTPVALSVRATSTGVVFATDFSRDTIHATTPVVTADRTNWYVMASKTATASTVGDDLATTSVVETRPLTLTLNATTTSGQYQAATVFAPAQRPSLALAGSSLRATLFFSARNVSTFGVGFFNSGGVLPHTSHMNNLAGTTTLGVTDTLLGGTAEISGGVQGWTGYRGAVFSGNTSSAQIVTRQPQTDSPTTNGTQDLVVPGSTGASYTKPAGAAIGPITNSPAAYLALVDDVNYALVYEIIRASDSAYDIAFRIHAVTESGGIGAQLFSSVGSTTVAGTGPASVAAVFDAFAFGARTTSSASLSRLVAKSLSIEYQTPVVQVAPSISLQPVARRVNSGDSVAFTVAAGGTPAPAFRWKKDGTLLPGATSATLTIPAALPSDAGVYVCEAYSSAGTAVSDPATLAVNTLPVFTVQPAGAIVVRGAPVTLTAAASGEPTPTYQWYRGASPVEGATAASLTLSAAALADAGLYSVRASNLAGFTTSASALLVVRTPYEAWVDAQSLDLADDGAPTADPAGDGVANLIRFALGGDPAVPGSTPLPGFRREGATYVFSYTVKTAALADFEVRTELSADLASWTAAVHGVAGVGIVEAPSGADARTVTVSIPAGDARLFARLRVAAKP